MNGERTVFGWDGDTLAYETNSDSSTHYVYEAGSFVPLAQFVTASVTGIETPVWKPTDRYLPEEDPLQRVPQRTAEARVFYYHCDQIGTPLMMTDDVGDVVWEASYKAWGEARKVIERASKAAGITPRNPIRFQGQQEDPETGLSYNRYRYYDPAAGRYASQDPIGLRGGMNVYQYVRNPMAWADPLGLTPIGDGGHTTGTGKPLPVSAPDSIYTKTDASGAVAVQNTIYGADGRAIGQVDFKNHGGCALSGHGHELDPPGNFRSAHGPTAVHIPPADVPDGWSTIPAGLKPATPIGE